MFPNGSFLNLEFWTVVTNKKVRIQHVDFRVFWKETSANFLSFVLFDCLSVAWVSHMESDLQCEHNSFLLSIYVLLPIYCSFFVGKVAEKSAFSTHKNCIQIDHQKCWKYQKLILRAEYIEKVVRYDRNSQLISENGWSQVGRWFQYMCFLGHWMWYLDQFTKIALTYLCDELCRATGPYIVCFDRVEVFHSKEMTWGRFSGDRRNVSNLWQHRCSQRGCVWCPARVTNIFRIALVSLCHLYGTT